VSWEPVLTDQRVEIWSHVYPAGVLEARVVVVKHEDAFTVYGAGINMSESFGEKFKVDSQTSFDLFVPNAWHNLGIKEWSNTFPKAKVYAHHNALPRLSRKGFTHILPAENFSSPLIKQRSYEESKTGELWLDIDAKVGHVWLIGDAFFNLAELPKNRILRSIFKLLRNGPGLRISRLFLMTAIKDRAHYKTWLSKAIENEPPVCLIPSHGEVLTHDVAGKMRSAVELAL
jgi:hypothetical protein